MLRVASNSQSILFEIKFPPPSPKTHTSQKEQAAKQNTNTPPFSCTNTEKSYCSLRAQNIYLIFVQKARGYIGFLIRKVFNFSVFVECLLQLFAFSREAYKSPPGKMHWGTFQSIHRPFGPCGPTVTRECDLEHVQHSPMTAYCKEDQRWWVSRFHSKEAWEQLQISLKGGAGYVSEET